MGVNILHSMYRFICPRKRLRSRFKLISKITSNYLGNFTISEKHTLGAV